MGSLGPLLHEGRHDRSSKGRKRLVERVGRARQASQHPLDRRKSRKALGQVPKELQDLGQPTAEVRCEDVLEGEKTGSQHRLAPKLLIGIGREIAEVVDKVRDVGPKLCREGHPA